MEDVVDTGATLALDCYLFDEPTFNFVTVAIEEHVDQMEDHWSFVLAQVDLLHLQLEKFSFFALQLATDLLVQRRNAPLDMSDEDLVE